MNDEWTGFQREPAQVTGSSAMPDEFDRAFGLLDGLKHVLKTKPAIVNIAPPFGIGGMRTYIVQTVREREVVSGNEDKARPRFTLFLQRTGDSPIRVVLPAHVGDLIVRQRDQLTTQARKKQGKASAQARKARGEKPGFQLNAAERAERKKAREKADYLARELKKGKEKRK
jgi:hypothetical protein